MENHLLSVPSLGDGWSYKETLPSLLAQTQVCSQGAIRLWPRPLHPSSMGRKKNGAAPAFKWPDNHPSALMLRAPLSVSDLKGAGWLVFAAFNGEQALELPISWALAKLDHCLLKISQKSPNQTTCLGLWNCALTQLSCIYCYNLCSGIDLSSVLLMYSSLIILTVLKFKINVFSSWRSQAL